MATIQPYDTAKGKRYRVRYRTPEGKQTDKRGFETKKAAEAFANQVEVSILRGEFIAHSDGRVTIGELGPEWLARQRGHMKPSAFAPLETAWRRRVLPEWGEHSISQIRPSEVQAWVTNLGIATADEKPVGASVIIRTFGVLAAILDDAVKDRLILANPARGTKLPKKTRKHSIYLSHEQVWELAHNSREYKPLVLLLAYTGIRWGEMRALRGADVDLIRKRIHVRRNVVRVGTVDIEGTPKNHKSRTVPIPATVAMELRTYGARIGGEELFFPGEQEGEFFKRPHQRFGWWVKAVDATACPRITPHDLRHTAASLAVQAGANVKAVQKMLGHSSAAMTLDVYADLFDDDLEAVATSLDSAIAKSDVGKMWAKPDMQA